METRSIFDKARIIVAKNMTDPYITMLLEALYRKNRLTYTHSINVGYLTAQICIFSCIEKKIAIQVVRGALLHDIGKLFVPLDILEKKERLTDSEFEIVKMHTVNGVMLLSNLTPNIATEIILDIVENHHEKKDGKGYFGKTDISFYAQLIHAVDIYDAITADRPYNGPMSSEHGLQLLKDEGVDNQILNYISKCKVR